MVSMRKFNTVLMFLFVFVSGPASAESYSGYVIESLNTWSPTFGASLIGMSTSPTGIPGGPGGLYKFTGDRTIAEILANARIHQQLVTVDHSAGTITGVYINR